MLDWSKPGQKYAQMALDYCRLAGIKSGEIPIISRRDHPQQWREWYAYYGFRRLHAIQAIMREKDEKTVPTLSPYDFDAEFNPQPHQLGPVPKGDGDPKWAPPTPEAKARVAALMKGLQRIEPAAPDRYKKQA